MQLFHPAPSRWTCCRTRRNCSIVDTTGSVAGMSTCNCRSNCVLAFTLHLFYTYTVTSDISCQQEVVNVRKEGPPNVLANKFTSETPANKESETGTAVLSAGVNPVTLPPGLTLRTPAASLGSPATSSTTESSRCGDY